MAVWLQVGTVSSEALVDTRLQAHWAAQIAAAAAEAHVEKRPDDSQGNLGWSDDYEALMTHDLPGGARVGLRLADLTLISITGGQIKAEIPMQGLTLQAGMDQLAEQLSSLGLPERALSAREYDMPEHAVGDRASFAAPTETLSELAAWFANAHQLLGAVVLNEPAASPVRCWPHHFDIATLVTFDRDKDPESARSVGIGLSPGDAGYPEPYFYVNPWPYPEPSTLAPLRGAGDWHTSGWVGAVLKASKLVSETPEEQLRRAEGHLVESYRACRHVLKIGD